MDYEHLKAIGTFTTLQGVKIGDLYYGFTDSDQAVVIDYTYPSSMFEGGADFENMIVDLSIPDNITYNGKSCPVVAIQGNAFRLCFDDMFLSGKLTIGKNLQYIGPDTFSGCNRLDTIICKADVPADLADYAFEGLSKNITCIVPCGQKAVYQSAAGWKWFNIVEDCGGVGIDDVAEGNIISVYPNPTKDFVVIENVECNAEHMTINVYDAQGRLILSETKPNATSYTLNTTSLKTGVYYITVG